MDHSQSKGAATGTAAMRPTGMASATLALNNTNIQKVLLNINRR